MNFAHKLQASRNLTRKKNLSQSFRVSLKATNTKIKIYIFRSTVLSLTVLLAVLFEHGMVSVTDITSVCMFTSS